jgi:hypothetical protein
MAKKKERNQNKSNLNAKNLGLAGGFLWGVTMLVGTWISMASGWASGLFELTMGLYPGYSISFLGSVIGGIYGFVDAFIGLYIFGWLYNRFQNK